MEINNKRVLGYQVAKTQEIQAETLSTVAGGSLKPSVHATGNSAVGWDTNVDVTWDF